MYTSCIRQVVPPPPRGPDGDFLYKKAIGDTPVDDVGSTSASASAGHRGKAKASWRSSNRELHNVYIYICLQFVFLCCWFPRVFA